MVIVSRSFSSVESTEIPRFSEGGSRSLDEGEDMAWLLWLLLLLLLLLLLVMMLLLLAAEAVMLPETDD
jgi:hypothetical protein